ncbi:hypothetical protein LRS13_22705 [Svornostia abyssi]|uniref:Uncharacterized protein n=1 Tax=Svornostia abyssi TaxID=2898438 RepID=A0ABY5PFW1_9ACTN|nr:hypothetical protein LRS13_22705 [Parviterribacteraceae bacterium J379]
MDYAEKHQRVADTFRRMVIEETAALVDAGSAKLELYDGTDHDGGELRPRRPTACGFSFCMQSAEEISFFPTAPGTDRTQTIDVYDKDPASLVSKARCYLRAFIAGRVKFTLRAGSSAGRVDLLLDDGAEVSHLYNVLVGFRVGRGAGWERYTASPYD